MEKIFLDTNVILDFLSDRKPFADHIASILTMAEKKQIKIFVSAISFNNIYYILKKYGSHNKAIHALKELSNYCEIVPVNRPVILDALNSEFRDFEDAIQNFSAQGVEGLQIIITRNTKDFKKSGLSIMTPEEFLKK
jgi:predicted nucleic acid-binding protein